MESNFEREVIDRLARLEQNTEPIGGMNDKLGRVVVDVEVMKTTVGDHERRIGGIEGWGKWLVAAVGILIIGQIGSLLIP